MIKLDEICRYPVKGLSADIMPTAKLTIGGALPLDRKWGIIHTASAIDASSPKWAPKKNFLMMAKDEKIGWLSSKFNEDGNILTILRKGKQISRGSLDDPMGKQVLQTFLTGFMPGGARGHPKIVKAPAEDCFTDVPENYLSIINLESVKDLETRIIRDEVHPHRFRGNLYISGAPAWSELGWIGKKLIIGDVELEVVEPIARCQATNIIPGKGEVNMNIPLSLQKAYGHRNCGVYVKVTKGGTIHPSDEITVE